MTAHDYTNRLIFVISLPRSRTAWLCDFFNPFMVTWHDPLKHCESIEELAGKIDRALFNTEVRANQLFIADTAACLFMPEIVARFPGARFVVIEREEREVTNSLRKKGMYSLGIMTSVYATFRTWRYVLPSKHTYIIPYGSINSMLRLVIPFITNRSIAQTFRSETDFTTYRDKKCARNVQVPFSVQNQQTNWPKVRKLLKGRVPFAHDSRLREDA